MTTRRHSLRTLGQLLLVSLLGLPLITPLLKWTAVPCTHDGHLHVHRIAALRYAWENGLYFSRWMPDLAFGYGYPFFVYREPGPLYAVLLPHLLGLPLPAASNLFYALTILAAGWFMFLWVRDIAGARAGLVSAVAYMAAPYVLLDALVRGNAPESMALPLLPFLLWIGRRWLLSGNVLPFIAGVLGLALLSLSHNISTLIFAPSLLIYLLVIGRARALTWPSLLGRLALFFGLGFGLTLWYTGGALLEMDQVTLSQSTVTRNNDFHFNFASLGEILAPVSFSDSTLLNPPLLIRLGLVPALLALIGATTPLWNRWMNKEQRLHIGLMILAALLYLFMALPLSLPLWEGVPLIDFVQFPWRFIGRAALPVAFLAGMPFMTPPADAAGSRRSLWVNIAAITSIALLNVEALPALYPRYCEEDAFPTIVDVHDYEADSGLVGVDPEGSYFPRTVKTRPDGSPLQTDYENQRTPQRFDRSLLPAAATAEIIYRPLGATISVNSPEPFTARYLTFDFPGWEAQVDGQAVAITPGDPDGLITFPVPAGSHTLTVDWRSTPLRSTLTAVSAAALLGVVAVVFVLRTRRVGLLIKDQPPPETNLVLGLIVVALALLAFKLFLVDNELTPLRRAGEPNVAVPAALQAAELQFAGHSLSREQGAAGETVDIDLAWRSTAPTMNTYQSNVWLSDADGLLWSDKETQRPRLYEDGPATWERSLGQWAWDSREMQILPGTPPGRYDIIMTLFDRNTLQPVTLRDQEGAVVGPTAVIGTLEVTMPADPPAFRPQYELEMPFANDGLLLLGVNQDRAQATPGEQVHLTFFWEKTGASQRDDMTLELLDEAGQVSRSWTIPVIATGFQAGAWSEGERLRAQHAVRLPATLESGRYQWRLEGQMLPSDLAVTAPARRFERPHTAEDVDQTFGDVIQLAGYTTRADGNQLSVELLWQALREMEEAYRVFVHLVDGDGQIISQSDGEPADWTRPTTGWAAGEYLIDRHLLTTPANSDLNSLRLRVGLYDAATGQRLTSDGADAVELALSP